MALMWGSFVFDYTSSGFLIFYLYSTAIMGQFILQVLIGMCNVVKLVWDFDEIAFW